MAELEAEFGASESWASALTTGLHYPLLDRAMQKITRTSTLLVKYSSFQWGQMDTQGQMLS